MNERVDALLTEVGLPAAAAAGVVINGADPVFDSPYPLGEVAAAALGAIGAASALLWTERGGHDQRVAVDVRRAAADLTSIWLQTLGPGFVPGFRGGNPLADFYRGQDGRFVFVNGLLPHLADGLLKLLRCAPAREDLAAAVARWPAGELEQALAEVGMVGAMVRSKDEWDRHPQAHALRPLGAVRVERVADSPPEPLPASARPLGGVRALDLTRLLAGPTAGKHLIEHGAEVLQVASPFVSSPLECLIDTGNGKLSTYLHLDDPDQAHRLRGLVEQSDIFLQNFRPGALERRGFGPDELIAVRPGLIYVSVSCYGDVGPWRGRGGFEHQAQSITGISVTQGTAAQPALLPANLCDYTTGHLAALGALAALWRRHHEGGAYHVRVSLTQTAMWLQQQWGPVCDRALASGPWVPDDWYVESDTAFGRLRQLAPVIEMSATAPRWRRGLVAPGTHAPAWPERVLSA